MDISAKVESEIFYGAEMRYTNLQQCRKIEALGQTMLQFLIDKSNKVIQVYFTS
jgi:hypothetical protein